MITSISLNGILDRLDNVIASISAIKAVKGRSLSKNEYC